MINTKKNLIIKFFFIISMIFTITFNCFCRDKIEYYINKVYGLTNNVAFLIGVIYYDSVADIETLFLKTTDGGKSWKRIDLIINKGDLINTIYFINSRVGFVGGNFAVETPGAPFIYSTDDSGITWHITSVENGLFSLGEMLSIVFYSSDHGEMRFLNYMNQLFDINGDLLSAANKIEIYYWNDKKKTWIAKKLEVYYDSEYPEEYLNIDKDKKDLYIYKNNNWELKKEDIKRITILNRKSNNEKWKTVGLYNNDEIFWSEPK